MGSRAALLLVICAVFCVGTQQATIDYCEVLHNSLLFYEAQRSGRLPSTNRIPWRGHSALKDCTATGCVYDSNGDGNLAGGYYDAGDGVKFGLPGAWSLTVLAWGLLEFKSSVVACGELSYYLDALKWGLDWWIKAHPSANVLWGQVGEGGPDHSYWGPPESMTYTRRAFACNNGGTELAMEVAAACAAGSIVFAREGNTAYASLLKSHAVDLWTFGNTVQASYTSSIPDASSFYNSWSGFKDEIVWGSAWLYYLTNSTSYLSVAESNYPSITNNIWSNSFDWDNKAPGAAVLLSKLTKKSNYASDVGTWFNWWQNSISYTPGGMAWIREWGPARYTANTAFLASVVSGSASANAWVQGQINYMLGVNSRSQSFVVGYGPNAPKNPHHRAAHGSTSNDINNPSQNKYVLLGALVGGPGRDDSYVDSRTDYVKNEVALDYNAGFTGAVAALAAWFPTGWSTGPSSPTGSISGGSGTPGTSGGSCGAGSAQASGCNGLRFLTNPNINSQWFAINAPIAGVGAAVSTLEIKDSGSYGNYAIMKWESWEAWSFTATLTPPLSLRVTLCNGVQHTFNNIITSLTGNTAYCGIPASTTTGSSTTGQATSAPTAQPTKTPTAPPTAAPSTRAPTAAPSTRAPTAAPTTKAPTSAPTSGSTTKAPTTKPSTSGSATSNPTTAPSAAPTTAPTKVATPAPSGAPTAAPSTPTSTNPNIKVYDDELRNSFADWSWATRDFSYSTNVNTGTKTIALTINSPWAALYIYKSDGIDTSKVKGIEFYIRKSSSTGTYKDIKFNLLYQDGNANAVGTPYVIATNNLGAAYERVYVDFDLQNVPRGLYDGLWIQDHSNSAQSTLLIDDITLIGR